MNPLTRREVLTASTLAATALLDLPALAAPGKSADEIRVGLIGSGVQGRNLLTHCLKIPGVRITAVCDIWDFARSYAINVLKKYYVDDKGNRLYPDPAGYIEYQEMLEKSGRDIDAVIIATPDWVHHEQTIACLRAGKHVYCEKEMSNTLEKARAIVRAARDTGKLVQIGHQRRSNPRYWHARSMIEKEKICGRITHVYGQWNRNKRLELGWPKKEELSAEMLKRFGYDTMERFRNWRWYKTFSGGPMADLGSHQVEVFSWFLGALPRSVMAGGGADYYQDRDWYDHIMAIYDWQTPAGLVRGTYQILNTTSWGNFYEVFMGDQGALTISEDSRIGSFFREPDAKKRDWEAEAESVRQLDRDTVALRIGESLRPDASKTPQLQQLMEQVAKPPHQLHLENFFAAVRAGDGSLLTCPPEIGLETCATVLKANEALAQEKRLRFSPDEFTA